MAFSSATINKTKSKQKIYNYFYGYLFISPILIGFLVFVIGPLIQSFYMSLTNWSLPGGTEFIGIDNFRNILTADSKFWKVLGNTFYFSVGLVPLNLIIAFGLALILKQSLKGIGIFRTAIFTPVVTSIVVWSIIWKFIFGTETGIINMFLKTIGITGPAWLYDLKLAMPVVILVSV